MFLFENYKIWKNKLNIWHVLEVLVNFCLNKVQKLKMPYSIFDLIIWKQIFLENYLIKLYNL